MPKLSEQIWDYSEPLLAAAGNMEAQKRAAELAIICWNTALLPDSEVGRVLGPTIENLAGDDATLRAELLAIFLMMQERKREHFADDNRLVVNYSLSDTADGVHLLVTSTPMNGRHPATLPASGL